MIFKDNILYLHFADIVPDPISINAYKSAKRRDNLVIHGRGGNGREVLIEYETLPARWKDLITSKYECPYRYAAAQIIKPHLTCPSKDIETITSFVTSKGEHLPLEVQAQYQTACAYLALMERTSTAAKIRKIGFPSKGKFTEAIQYLIDKDGIDLPANYSNLKKKLRQYCEQGATAVISGKWGNSNTEKITEEMERWMILEMCRTRLSPEIIHQRYLKIADSLGEAFRKDISADAFKHRLSQPHIKQLIDIKRYGKTAVRSKTGQTFKIVPPVYSDDYWQGDGTAIDLAFRNDDGKLGMATVYIVVDVLSEVMLGWSIRQGLNKENFEMQMAAYRHAVRTSGSKPYQLKYDNQGGHKMGEAKRFYDTLADVHFPSRARRSSARRVEGIFGRIQTTILAEYPFWTGYGRHTHSDLRHGHDRLKMQRNLHNLPSFEELTQLWEVIAIDWNSAKHPSAKRPRNEVYQERKDPNATPVEYTDMVDMFFQVSDPIKYQANGITLTRNNEAHTYAVYTGDGLIDYDFRIANFKKRFHIKYDPEFEYPSVELLEPMANGDMRPVATAQPIREVHDVVKYLEPGERKYIDAELDNEEAHYTALESKAKDLGYDEDQVFTQWRAKIGKKPNRNVYASADPNESEDDFLLNQM